MYDMNAFADEYISIQKEAALMGGIRALKGAKHVMSQGFQGAGKLSGGKKGITGALTAGKNYVKRMAGSRQGSKNLAMGAGMVAAPAAGAAYLASR